MCNPYYVYILECADHTLYTGITTDVNRRLQEHESGKGAKYTRGRSPYKLRYIEIVENKSSALSREKHIKSLNRSQKWQLIKEVGLFHVSSKKL